MAFRINYNYLANFTLTQLHGTEKNLNKVVTQLSSGRRIVTAADDVSGYNIVQRLTRVSKGIEQGIMNSQDGMSLAQVALSATQQMIDNYQTVRQKALQAANETVNPSERKQIGIEIAKIIEAMDRLAQQVDFNEFKLFQSANLNANGVHYNSFGYVAEQYAGAQKLTLELYSDSSDTTATTISAVYIGNNAYIIEDSKNDFYLIKGAVNNTIMKADLKSSYKFSANNAQQKFASILEYNSKYVQITDALVSAISGNKLSRIMNKVAANFYADTYQFMIQYGPEAAEGKTSFGANGTGDNRIFVATFTENVFSNVLRIQVKDKNYQEIAQELESKYGFGEGAAESKILDFADKVGRLINVLSDRAADLGSTINQLQSIVNFNEQAKTTIDEATSRIRDVDFAKATAKFQQLQILMQSGTAMLAQANQLPQYALRLVG